MEDGVGVFRHSFSHDILPQLEGEERVEVGLYGMRLYGADGTLIHELLVEPYIWDMRDPLDPIHLSPEGVKLALSGAVWPRPFAHFANSVDGVAFTSGFAFEPVEDEEFKPLVDKSSRASRRFWFRKHGSGLSLWHKSERYLGAKIDSCVESKKQLILGEFGNLRVLSPHRGM